MIKSRLSGGIIEMIRTCYESDVDHMLKYHVTGDLGIEHSIQRTVFDFISMDVNIYTLHDKDEFVGYFGDEDLGSNGRWLTGFFITPKKRKSCKQEFWNMIVDHFNGEFKIGIFVKNEPAKKFLMNNGCKLIKTVDTGEAVGSVYKFSKECV